MPIPTNKEWSIFKEKGKPYIKTRETITARWQMAEFLAHIQKMEANIMQGKAMEKEMALFADVNILEIDSNGETVELNMTAREAARDTLGMDSSPEKKGEPASSLPQRSPTDIKGGPAE
jgi:hypothetical protein